MNHSWQPDGDQRRRERFWRTAPPDPIRLAKQAGLPHYNRALGQVLMPQSAMPIGAHAGKIMSAVPADYLAWVNVQPWDAAWPAWAPVRDYIERHPVGIMSADDATQPDPVHLWPAAVVYVSPLMSCPPTSEWRWTEFAELTGHPDHEDKLHAFAAGALGLLPRWFQTIGGESRHYRLTATRRLNAIQAGAAVLPPSRKAQAMHFQRLREDGTATCTKHCYPSKKDADTVANERSTGRQYIRRNRPEVHLRSYECPRCGFWHLTKQPPRA